MVIESNWVNEGEGRIASGTGRGRMRERRRTFIFDIAQTMETLFFSAKYWSVQRHSACTTLILISLNQLCCFFACEDSG